MINYIKRFVRDDSGAVTVDWVVLTAAVVGLGVLLTSVITTGVTDLSDGIWAYMDSLDLFGAGGGGGGGGGTTGGGGTGGT